MSVTLTDLCEAINNWFDTKSDGTKDRHFGTFTIQDGFISLPDCDIKNGQYFRIIGSVFNDGVYQYPTEDLTEEVFDGAIWIMYVPKQIFSLLDEINEWDGKYGDIASSPFNSESFGGYTYYKTTQYGDQSNIIVNGWESQFSRRLDKYRKTRNLQGDK